MSNRFIRACFRCLVIPLISESLQKADESLLFHNVISNSWAAQWLSTPRRGKQADLNPGSRLPGSNFLFIRVCLPEFLLYLVAESPGLAPYFLFRLYSCSMSPVKNPGEIPTPCFQETATKCPIPRQIGFDTKLSGIQDGKPEVTVTSLLFNCMWINPSAHFFPHIKQKDCSCRQWSEPPKMRIETYLCLASDGLDVFISLPPSLWALAAFFYRFQTRFGFGYAEDSLTGRFDQIHLSKAFTPKKSSILLR